MRPVAVEMKVVPLSVAATAASFLATTTVSLCATAIHPATARRACVLLLGGCSWGVAPLSSTEPEGRQNQVGCLDNISMMFAMLTRVVVAPPRWTAGADDYTQGVACDGQLVHDCYYCRRVCGYNYTKDASEQGVR